jgi:hypothetical protein
MIEQDTVKLLRECDAGAKMGVESIGSVLDRAQAPALHAVLAASKAAHEKLGREIRTALSDYGDAGKDPGAAAETMSRLKTEAMLLMKADDDAAIADLMTDGCSMGVKSLSRYLNQYKAADERSKELAGRLIRLEQSLAEDLRQYL